MFVRIYYFTVIVLFVFGCSSETKPEVQKTSTITTKVSSDTLHLNKVDKLFLPYMPDTSVILKTQEERKKYVFELYKNWF